jgi:hypothetical protein
MVAANLNRGLVSDQFAGSLELSSLTWLLCLTFDDPSTIYFTQANIQLSGLAPKQAGSAASDRVADHPIERRPRSCRASRNYGFADNH